MTFLNIILVASVVGCAFGFRISKSIEEEHDVKKCHSTIEELEAQLGCYKEAPYAKFSRDCMDTYPRRKLQCTNGAVKIYPLGYNCDRNQTQGFDAFCDQETSYGGWTVIQRRRVRNKPPEKAHKEQVASWYNLVNGFGNVSEQFWLGLKRIRQLTFHGKHTLRVELTYSGKFTKIYAEYSDFKIGTAEQNYTLTVSGYSGNATDQLSHLNGLPFRRFKGNEKLKFLCSSLNWGGWWFQDGYKGCRPRELKTFNRFRWLGNRKIRSIEMKVRRQIGK